MKLTCDIMEVKNIGEKRKEMLEKINIRTVYDLITYYPRTYDDRSKVINIEEIDEGTRVSLQVRLVTKPENYKFNNLNITRVKAKDDTGTILLVWFNQPFLAKTLIKDETYLIYGKAVKKSGKIQIDVLEFQKGGKIIDGGAVIVPIYTLPKGFSQKSFRKIMYQVIKDVDDNIEEYFSPEVMNKYNLENINTATRSIHFPKSNEEFYKARNRLVFDELFLMQGALFNIKGFAKKETGVVFQETNYNEILKLLKYSLTNAQKKVIEEIKEDFSKGLNMNRLVQGDVGSGKTIVAIISGYIAMKNGYQCVIMAPTEVLATQHYMEVKKILDNLNIPSTLLVGSLKAKEKREVLEKIKNGESMMIVGTHALIQDKVVYNNLGLVITDEQHRFGVRQRGVLSEKGSKPHMLVMTATPIPRTLGLILYGDLDISIIDEMPPGRQKIDTFVVGTNMRERIYNFIKKEVSDGGQVYIVCPAIEENENSKLKTVIGYTEELKMYFENKISIEYLHGKMKEAEKKEIMESFKLAKTKVLVSTTVIEVGINVPNATLMIVEDSQRFGLSQLHQLRGRVGRGQKKSYCILVSDAKSKVTKKRLKAMETTNDGFVLSEEDLKLRGHGDFFGNRQHGLPEYKIANLYEDIEILKDVQKLWENILNGKINLTKDNSLYYKIEKYANVTKNIVYL